MPAALTLTKASPAAREGFGHLLELEHGFDGTLLCESESVHGGPEHRDVKRELTPWFYLFALQFTLGLLGVTLLPVLES
jgi:hypothetical protein